MVLLETVEDGGDWEEAERRWIALTKDLKWPITNMSSGGEGFDPEVLASFWKSPDYSEARKRRIDNLNNTRNTQEYKDNHTKAMQEVYERPEVIEKRSQQFTNMWRDEEYRNKKVAELSSDERRQFMSRQQSGRWQDEEYRRRMDEVRWNEEARDKQAALILTEDRQRKIKAALTPDVILKRNAAIKKSWEKRRVGKPPGQPIDLEEFRD